MAVEVVVSLGGGSRGCVVAPHIINTPLYLQIYMNTFYILMRGNNYASMSGGADSHAMYRCNYSNNQQRYNVYIYICPFPLTITRLEDHNEGSNWDSVIIFNTS